jgi:capsular exopolysaccharide synthesis family protein
MNDTNADPSNGRGTAGRLVPQSRPAPAPRDPYGQLNPYTGGAGEAPADSGLDLLEYWRILNKRKWLILSIAGAFLAFGALRTLMMTPLYTATVRLQIDRNVAKVVSGGDVSPIEGADSEFLRTQYALLLSRAMAERVASALKLGEDATFFKPREFSPLALLSGLFRSRPTGEPNLVALERAAAGIVVGNRAVLPVAGSRLVDVSYSDPSPERAQQIAAAYADAYISSNLDKRFEANSYAKTFLEDQLKQLKIRLEESEKTALDFAEQEQIVVLTEKSTIAESNLAAAHAALGQLVADRIKNQELWQQVESADTINLPQLLLNSTIDSLRGRRGALVADYEERLQTFKPSYPDMIQIKNKIAELDRQLALEVKTLKQSYKAAYEASLNQEAEMRKQIETLKEEALDLQKRSIQYNILRREADTNRSLYDGLLQRYKEIDVAGGAGANNVFVVDKAEVPGAPSSPVLSRALMFSFALGLGAGLAAAYVLERLDDTIKTSDEIGRISGLATLGIIPKVGSETTVEQELADPRSGLSEGYRSLCTALQFSSESGLPKTLLITSSGPAEGKSITSLAVARHFATMGLKVLLIDADLRNPSLHVKLGLDSGVGLSNYLTGACTPPETFQTTAVHNMAFMASGPLPPNAADLLGSSRLLSLVSVGLEVFNLIVIDGPPVMGLADAPLLSSVAAGTVFVVGAGQARRGFVQGALKRLELARGPVVGAVLTKYDHRAAGYGYGYGYGEYGYGGYGSDARAKGQAVDDAGHARPPELTSAQEGR